MDEDIVYLTKEQTGLPFDVIKDNFFEQYYARYDRGHGTSSKQHLNVSQLIEIHLLVELRNLQAAPDSGPS